MHKNENEFIFNNEDIQDAIWIWNHAGLLVMDIQHSLLSSQESLCAYRLPASTFIYIIGANTNVLLDDCSYRIKRYGLFHAGKGHTISINGSDHWIEYYMLFYKTRESGFYHREYIKMLQKSNPFQQIYGFEPSNPIFFTEILKRMFETWKQTVPLNALYVKTCFYHMIYEIYKELDSKKINIIQPDVVNMAKRYLDEHYAENLSIGGIRETLGISNAHFNRLFQSQTGKSPQEYLIFKRLLAVKEYLIETDYTLKEIAVRCGFYDEFSLMKMFKKHFHMSAKEYRDINTYQMGNETMENLNSFLYNKKSQVSIDELKEKGVNTMLSFMKNKAVAVSAISLVMLLSACSNLPANVSDSQVVETQEVNEQNLQTEKKVIQTVMGEVEIPVNPERVFAEAYWVGDILALGITPVAVERFFTGQELFTEELKNTTYLDSRDPEVIMTVEPDLIITRYEEDFETLNKIAPTVVIPWDVADAERLPFLAEVLGKESKDGEAVLEEYEQLVTKQRERISESGLSDQSVTVLRDSSDGNVMIQIKAWAAGAVYEDLAMEMPEGVKQLATQNPEVGGKEVSIEVISQFIGDIILYVDSGAYDTLKDNEVWNAIPAVKEGNVIVINDEHMFFTDMETKSAKLLKITDDLLNSNNSLQ